LAIVAVTNGGSTDIELNELTVIPCRCSLSPVVRMATPLAQRRMTSRKSTGFIIMVSPFSLPFLTLQIFENIRQ